MLIAILLLVILALFVSCKNKVAKETGEFTFEKNDDIVSYVLTGYTGTDRGIEIPSKYNGYPVRIIDKEVFKSNKNLQSVVIPNTVINIEDSAFAGCSELTSVTIPKSVKRIGKSAFANCSGLEGITVASKNAKYHSAGNCLIETASKTLIVGCKNSVIPTDGSVTSIGEYAFSGCSGLTSITIPNSVTSIGEGAFGYCRELKRITIPNSVTSIGDMAFTFCIRLKEVNFENTSGWYVTKTSGSDSGMRMSVTDASTNASNLRTNYYNYFWYRK